MIFNASLLRVDPPAPGSPGPDVSVRCCLTPLTDVQDRLAQRRGWDASFVVYLPARKVPTPAPVEEGQVLLQRDGTTSSSLYHVVQVVPLTGRTFSYVQLFVAPAE
jgi:hypothetical protein